MTDLALANFINNRPITSDAEDCLHLVEIERYRPRLSVAKSRIVVGAQRFRGELRPRARGEARSLTYSQQAEAGIAHGRTHRRCGRCRAAICCRSRSTRRCRRICRPSTASVTRSAGQCRDRTATRPSGSCRGISSLFEQMLADVTAQLGNINRFFSGDAGEDTTYFTRPLFDLPGVPDLLEAISSGRQLDGVRRPTRTTPSPAPSTTPRKAGPTCSIGATGCSITCWRARVKTRSPSGRSCTGGRRRELARSRPDRPISSAERIAARRDAANARLIRDEGGAAARRAGAQCVPSAGQQQSAVEREPRCCGSKRRATRYSAGTWRRDGQERLRSVGTFRTSAAASIAAENALWFAARAALYTVVARRWRLSPCAT